MTTGTLFPDLDIPPPAVGRRCGTFGNGGQRPTEIESVSARLFPVPDTPSEIKLRPYQEEAIQKMREAFRAGHKRVVLQMPTGSGKTNLAMQMAKGTLDRGRHVLFVCERITLVNQAAERFTAEGFHVGVIQGDNPGWDPDAPVQVASIQTLARRRIDIERFGLLIQDECHITAKANIKLMRSMPEVPVVGLSATPWAKKMGDVWDHLVVGQTVSELIRDGFLVDTEVYGPAQPDMKGVKIVTTRYGRDYSDSETAERAMKIVGDVVENWLRYGQDRQTAMFAATIAHSKALTDAFSKAGVPAVHIDAYTVGEERAGIFRTFTTGDARIISSVDVLGRGWDEPQVGCIIDARPTKSLIRHVQIIGRGLRPAPGKENCIVLDFGGNHERHGFVTDPLPDKLHRSTIEMPTEPPKKLPKVCPKCKFMKPAGIRKCPSCGFTPVQQCDIKHEDGELIRITRSGAKKMDPAQRERIYAELLGYAKEKGYKDGWAWHKVRTLFDDAPKQRPEPRTPSQATRNWIKGQAIRYRKAQEKAGRIAEKQRLFNVAFKL